VSESRVKVLQVMRAILIGLLAVSLVGCTKKDQRYESVCQVIRKDVVEENDKGEPEIMDIELEWDPCPGDQFQVVRGGKDFATCMQKVEVGSLQPVLVKRWWDTRGYFTWDVYKVGECAREIEPDSEGSYEKSAECNDDSMYGQTTGFKCSRRPFKKLVSVCPWMARQ
jgi:hypothetical protein